MSSTDPDIVLGTESWLKPEILNCEVFPEEYTVYWKDRDIRHKLKGGGVFILVRIFFTSCEIEIDTECEALFVDLKLVDQQNVKIGCLYRPPWSDETYMKDFERVVKHVDPHRNGNLWIGGDFNLPKIDWTHQKILPQNPSGKISTALLNLTNDFSLTQIVDHPTRKENILDLFFTTNPILVNQVMTVPPLSNEADHDIVFIDLNTRAQIPRCTPSPRYIYSKADWESMRSELENYSLPDKPVQEQWDHLENTLKSLMNKYIPQKVPRRQKHKPWITRDLITELHQRNRAFRKWKKTQSDDHYVHYLKLRSTCQKNVRNANSDYISNIFNLENPDEPDKSKVTKRFWTYVKSKKKDSCCVSPLKSEGVLVSDAKGKANILNSQYCSVFGREDDPNIPSKGDCRVPTAPDIKVTEDGVFKMLQALNSRKAPGPDKISPLVLRELAKPLSKPLSKFFQHSINSGVVPVHGERQSCHLSSRRATEPLQQITDL